MRGGLIALLLTALPAYRLTAQMPATAPAATALRPVRFPPFVNGRLTNGVIVVRGGDFVQAASTSATSFVSGGTVVRFENAGPINIQMATAPPAAFASIEFTGSGTVTLLQPVFASGLLLQVKKQVPWVQPAEQRTAVPVPGLSWETILAAAQAHPPAAVRSWEDIDRLDVRPAKGIVKVITKSRWELQLALADGATARGANVIDLGLASTDLLYFASGDLDARSASHARCIPQRARAVEGGVANRPHQRRTVP